ncbi:hypothetical protein F8154_03250 [Alkaliphilus pronyensis]|uniref:Uncharacterized protein n=1 Tax=Alkaliphilus pronyensis TaxID=1482732 RepID=A0A6I0F351_9FIRM|nr:hypothetical protein [Alkaliphilus pronyensis]KAB3537321.1 hypothetical protein F8154_03250 [Alkaliphilus pronyensis]
MGSLIWNNRTIIDFDNSIRDSIIASCISMSINYQLVFENIIISPALYNKTIILKTLVPQADIISLMKTIKASLEKEGAIIVIDEGSADKASLEYLAADIIIGFNFCEKPTDITIYLPFDIEESSTFITRNIIKQFAFWEKQLSYRIADSWKKLKATKYWSYLFGNTTPSIILELSSNILIEDYLTNLGEILVKSIIDELGIKHSIEDKKKINDFISSYKEKLYTSNNIELEALMSKMIGYEEELEKLKLSLNEGDKHSSQQCNEEITTSSTLVESENDAGERIEIDNNKADDESNKSYLKENKPKHKKHKKRKVYLHMKQNNEAGSKKAPQGLQYPLRVPGNGPFHQFQPPSAKSSVALPPNPVSYSNSKSKNTKYYKMKEPLAKELPPIPNELQKSNDSNIPSNICEKTNNKIDNIYQLMYP